MIRKYLAKFLLIDCCLFFIGNVLAQNQKETVYLEADRITYEYKKGIVTYEGHVYGKQGLTTLHADKMIVYYNEEHQIKQVDALGDTASYSTPLKQNAKLLLEANAKKISYFPLSGKATLTEKAHLKYGNNEFSGPVILYDSIHEIITSYPQKNNKSKIILEPIKNFNNPK